MSDAPPSPTHESGGEQSPRGSSSGAREQDRYLPIANISRIMKKALPPNGKIAKDAKDTMQECVSEFISFITSESVSNYTYPYQMFCFYLAQNVFFFLMDDCSFLFLFFGDWGFLRICLFLNSTHVFISACRASEKCQKEKRKTINGDDLLWAMATLGFEDYIEPLKVYLARYREVIFLLLPFFLV